MSDQLETTSDPKQKKIAHIREIAKGHGFFVRAIFFRDDFPEDLRSQFNTKVLTDMIEAGFGRISLRDIMLDSVRVLHRRSMSRVHTIAPDVSSSVELGYDHLIRVAKKADALLYGVFHADQFPARLRPWYDIDTLQDSAQGSPVRTEEIQRDVHNLLRQMSTWDREEDF